MRGMGGLRVGLGGVLLVVVLVGVSSMVGAGSATAGECDWEWGGVTEATPAPCQSAIPVHEVSPSPAPGGGASSADVHAVDLTLQMGLGLLVMLCSIGLVWAWGRRRN